MIARIARAALAAGVLVGILAWGALQVRAVPILLQAEAYEQSAPGAAGHATHAEGTPATDHHNEGWRRHAKTFLTTILTGVGYAFLLVGAIMISSRPVDARSGALWGACGFVAFSAAPALGLPPVLPGMETAELGARQIWWLAAAGASAAGLALIAFARRRWTKIAGGAAMIVPHAVGAPQATTTAIYVPAQLAAEFAVVSLLVSAMFWVALGFLSGYFLKRQDSSEARS